MIIYGTTFSNKYCVELGLDWQECLDTLRNFSALKVFRVCAYWDQIETVRDNLDFSLLDQQLDMLKHKSVIVAFGRKSPRWPEYHEPVWTNDLSDEEFRARLLLYLDNIIDHLRQFEIESYQLENEPFVNFGGSRHKFTEEIFKEEYELLKAKTQKPVVITDSGENSDWKAAARYADLLGVNVYKTVYDSRLRRYYTHNLKAGDYAKKMVNITKPVFVAELQAEPWGAGRVTDLSQTEAEKSFSLEQLESSITMLEEAGFTTLLFWGCEWWYYQSKQGNNKYMDWLSKLEA